MDEKCVRCERKMEKEGCDNSVKKMQEKEWQRKGKWQSERVREGEGMVAVRRKETKECCIWQKKRVNGRREGRT